MRQCTLHRTVSVAILAQSCYLHAWRRSEVFIPQHHAPGAETEVDFGEVRVILNGAKTNCHQNSVSISRVELCDMGKRTTGLGFTALLFTGALLAGCHQDTNGPPVDGPEPTEERTYSNPSPEATPTQHVAEAEPGCRPARTAEDKALKPGLSFGQGSQPPQMDIHVTPIFKGQPDVEDITLSDHVDKSWLNKWSHKVNRHRLLLTVVQNPGSDARELGDDDLEKVTIRHSESPEDVIGLECDDPIPVSTKFVGERPADTDAHPTTMWEISSDADIASDPEQLITAWLDGDELNQLGAVHVIDQANDIFSSLGDTPSARKNLTFYYENR